MTAFTFILFFLSFSFSLSKYISSEISHMFSGFHMNLIFGTPPQKLKLEANMEIDYTWVTRYNFREKSKTQQIISDNDTLYFSNKRSLKANKISDKTVIIENENRNITLDFIAYHLEYKVSLDSDAIGLAYKFKDNSMSLVHTLYLNKYIDKLSFGFVVNKDEGFIYFGNLPDKIIKNSYETKIKVDDTQNKWGVKLSKVGGYYNIDYAYFNSGEELILAPYDYLSFIENVVLKDYLENKTCQRNIDESTKDYVKIYYSCDCNYIRYIKGLDFIIEGHRFELNNENLFSSFYRECRFVIEHKTNYPNQWVLGAHFMKKYKILFDYEESTITFYTDKPIKKDYYTTIISIYMFISITMLLVSLIMCIIKYSSLLIM